MIGDYWHSDIYRDKDYHLIKTNLTESKGYQLIHIFEHEWINKQDIIKAKLKALLNIDQTRIFARKCLIKEILVKEKNNFLNLYHIQGEDKSKVKLGLFYNDELVAVMTFAKPRFNKHYEYELVRFASKYKVIGGAGKLLKYFERNYKPKSIITYADRRFSKGNLYLNLNFKLNHISSPNYFYIKDNKIYSRYETQKHKLKNILQNNLNNNNSETENLINNRI